MDIFAIRLLCDLKIRDGLAFGAGQLLEVKRVFEKDTYQGKPVVVCEHDGLEFVVRGWEYTTDLTADPAELAAAAQRRIEVRIQCGLKEWNTDAQRKRSIEVDFGGWWTLHGDMHEFQKWCVSWIARTGEIYAWNARDDQYIVLGATETGDEARAEFFLEGWCDTESAVFHNLTALVEQLEARREKPTPEAFVKKYNRRQRAWG